jgi:hypothetical protein
MAGVTRIPRRRGVLLGLLLVVLGVWAGLGPLAGPSFRFAYSPDTAWHFNNGRLYLSIIPGAAALLGGLIVMATRSRALGMLAGLIAVAGGAWLVVGQDVVRTLLKRPSISAGSPLLRNGSTHAGALTGYQYAEMLAFFTGLGLVIVFFGALAMGRFAAGGGVADEVDATEYGDYSDSGDADAQPAPLTDEYPAGTGQFPIGQRPFPGEEPTQTQERFPSSSSTGTFPASSPTGRFPSSSFGSDS